MARPIRETPILIGEDALRFEKEINDSKPLSEVRCEEMRNQFKSINVWGI